MKNESVRKVNLEEKAGLTAATLPWWAKVMIAQHSSAAFPNMPHHIHYCFDCGCVLISTKTAYPYFSHLCPECSTKKQISQGGN